MSTSDVKLDKLFNHMVGIYTLRNIYQVHANANMPTDSHRFV
jgi:hypothetical protein